MPETSLLCIENTHNAAGGRIMSVDRMAELNFVERIGLEVLRRRIDTTGARPFFLLSLVLFALTAICWLLYLRQLIDGTMAMFGIYFVVGLGAVCWTVANLNYLPKVAPEAERALRRGGELLVTRDGAPVSPASAV